MQWSKHGESSPLLYSDRSSMQVALTQIYTTNLAQSNILVWSFQMACTAQTLFSGSVHMDSWEHPFHQGWAEPFIFFFLIRSLPWYWFKVCLFHFHTTGWLPNLNVPVANSYEVSMVLDIDQRLYQCSGGTPHGSLRSLGTTDRDSPVALPR